MEVLIDSATRVLEQYNGSNYYRYPVREYKAVNRVDTPNYFELVRSGIKPPENPYEVIHTKEYDDSFRGAFKRTGYTYLKYWCNYVTGYTGEGFGDLLYLKHDPNPPLPIAADPTASLLDRISDVEVNAALAWFERRETFSLIASHALRLSSAARDVRKGKFSRAAKKLGIKLSQRRKKRINKIARHARRNRLDQFADLWLEYRYGWTPLYHDIYNAASLISDGLNTGRDEISLKTSKRLAFNVSYESSFSQRSFTAHAEGIHRRGVGLTFSVMDSTKRWSNALGLSNPGLILWELVPFSFVADWFVPIGDSLRSLTAFQGLNFVRGYTNDLLKYNQTQDPVDVYKYTKGCGNYVTMTIPSIIRREFARFSRTPLTTFDDLLINPWSTRNGLNAVRALDSVTILQKVLKGSKTNTLRV